MSAGRQSSKLHHLYHGVSFTIHLFVIIVESELLVPMYCLKLLPVAWQEGKLLGPADCIDTTSEGHSIRVKGFQNEADLKFKYMFSKTEL